MKLWFLEPIDESKSWDPWYDKAFGFVVRAKSEQDARMIAANNCGDEGKDAWLDAQQSRCTPLKQQGKAEMVIRDFSAA